MQTTLDKLLKIVKKSYPQMTHLSSKEYYNIHQKINEELSLGVKNSEAVKDLYNKNLTILNHLARVYVKLNYPITTFEDAMSSLCLSIYERTNEKFKKGEWYLNYETYNSTLHLTFKQFVKKLDSMLASEKGIIFKSKLVNKAYYRNATLENDDKNEFLLKKVHLYSLSEEEPSDSFDMMEYNLERSELSKTMHNMFLTLNEQERRVVELHFGFNDSDELTLREVGEILNLSVERIRQILLGAIRKLRQPLRRNLLASFKNEISHDSYRENYVWGLYFTCRGNRNEKIAQVSKILNLPTDVVNSVINKNTDEYGFDTYLELYQHSRL